MSTSAIRENTFRMACRLHSGTTGTPCLAIAPSPEASPTHRLLARPPLRRRRWRASGAGARGCWTLASARVAAVRAFEIVAGGDRDEPRARAGKRQVRARAEAIAGQRI